MRADQARARDTESVPLTEPVEAFFEREVKPHVRDAWIDTARRDEKGGATAFDKWFDGGCPNSSLDSPGGMA